MLGGCDRMRMQHCFHLAALKWNFNCDQSKFIRLEMFFSKTLTCMIKY